jgi:hypothetical protein
VLPHHVCLHHICCTNHSKRLVNYLEQRTMFFLCSMQGHRI